MNPLVSMGIDASVSATGITVLESNGTPTPKLVYEGEIKPPSKLRGVERYIHITREVMTLVHKHVPDKIVLEGYSLNMKNASSVIPMVELGGLIRFLMHIDGLEWFDPRATEMKKFVSGKGTGDKAMIAMHVLKRWNHESATHNLADSYGLAAMGLAQANRLPSITQSMRQIAGSMKLQTC